MAFGFTFVFNSYIVRDGLFIGYLCDADHPDSLCAPRAYDFVALLMIIIQLPVQAMASLYRVIYLFAWGMLSLFRIDLSMMPRGLEGFDSGYTGFAAVLMMNERQNSPCLLTFLSCMVEKTPMRNHPMPTKEPERDAEKWKTLHAERREVIDAVTSYRREMDWQNDESTLKFRRMRTARNRWSLALLLIQNPSLRKYRKHRLFIPPVTEETSIFDTVTEGVASMQMKIHGDAAFDDEVPDVDIGNV
jgi:hypothetical protein